MEKDMIAGEEKEQRRMDKAAGATRAGKAKSVSLGRRSWKQRLLSMFGPKEEPASRSYRFLARQIQNDLADKDKPHFIALTSPLDLEAADEAALMLAYALENELDSKVLLVDATFGRTGISRLLGVPEAPGFMNGVYSPECDVQNLIQQTRRWGVSVIPAGVAPASGFSPLKRDYVRAFLQQAGKQFDYLLVQQGPVLQDTRQILVASQADMTLVLVQEQSTLLDDFQKCRRVLANHDIPGVQVVMVQEQ